MTGRARPAAPRPSTDRNGARWTLYGLPGGYTTAERAGTVPAGTRAADRSAVALVTFRGGPACDSRYDRPRRLDAARRWALDAFELVP